MGSVSKKYFEFLLPLYVLIVLSSIFIAPHVYAQMSTETCEATGTSSCYYVAVNGSDGNSGTFSSPYKTFRPALIKAQPGDFIYARGGTYGYDNSMVSTEGPRIFISIQNASGGYTVNNGTSGNPITVRNYPGENPILDLNDSRFDLSIQGHTAVEIREKSFWTVQGFEIVNGSIDLNSYPSGPTANASLTHDIVIKENNVHDVTVTGGSNPGLIRINRGDTGGAYNISIINNELHDFFDISSPGVWDNLPDEQHFGALTTISCQSYVNFECGGTGSIEFRGNHVYRVPQAFFFKNPAPGPVLIADNTIHDVSSLGTLITSNVTMHHNLVYGTDTGFWYVGRDGLESDPRVYTVSGQNAVITNNTFIGLNGLLIINNGAGHTVERNIFFGMQGRVPGAGYDTPAYIKKSLVYPDPSATSQSILQDITSNTNCFISPYSDFQMVQRHANGSIEHYTRQQALATFGYDADSVFITQANDAAVFVNPSQNDYHLLDPSQCPDMGYYAASSTTPAPSVTPSPTTPSPAPSSVISATSFFAYARTLRGGYHIASGNVSGTSNDEIIVGSGQGMGPQVRVFDRLGNLQSQFFAYASTLRNGVTVASCDVTGDGLDEIITGQARGGLPLVKIFSGSGQVINNGFNVLDGKFTGGINLACGDTNGDGVKEIVVAAMQGGGPHVLVYNAQGRVLTNFMAYASTFRGGINVSTLDMDADGMDEIVTGPQVGAPHVQIFQMRANSIRRLSPGFYAFHPGYRGGVSVAGVDTDGNGTKELLVGVGTGAQPLVKQYDVRQRLQQQFYVFGTNFTGGINLAGGDVDGDGADELLVMPRSAGGPNVRVIDVGGKFLIDTDY
ncbi:MAG: right-handed parallel beta-helix repeat-containing protein [Patescibacteria group bacterium]|jgi:hypothetical protein